jgi:DNA-binding FadR family transcriptional regulator
MTMAISGVSLASPTSLQNPNDPRQQFLQLARAINSGNLTGAQQAFAQLSQTLGSTANGNTDAGNSNDPLMQALGAIGQALQSGDIGAAQQALASLQQAQGVRGHRHHHGRADASPQGGTDPSTPSPPPSVTPATTGANVDVTA